MQPAQGIFFIHEAICTDVRAIESLALAAQTADALATLAERVAFLDRTVKLHTDGEEVGVFPQIEERLRHVGDGYIFDHRTERERFAALKSAIDAARRHITEGALWNVRRQSIGLSEHLQHHIEKENKLVVPLMMELFSPAEQGAHLGKMMATFAPADFASVLPWLVRNLEPESRLAYVSMLKAASPPERWGAIVGWIREGVEPDITRALATACPEFS